jgi:hypothetical protein
MALVMAPAPEDKRRRGRNLALGGLLLVLVAIFYALTIVRFGGHG